MVIPGRSFLAPYREFFLDKSRANLNYRAFAGVFGRPAVADDLSQPFLPNFYAEKSRKQL